MSELLGAFLAHREIFSAIRGRAQVSVAKFLDCVGIELSPTLAAPTPTPEACSSARERELEVYLDRWLDAYLSFTTVLATKTWARVLVPRSDYLLLLFVVLDSLSFIKASFEYFVPLFRCSGAFLLCRVVAVSVACH